MPSLIGPPSHHKESEGLRQATHTQKEDVNLLLYLPEALGAFAGMNKDNFGNQLLP